MTQWCSICSARPSDGSLEIENPVDPNGETMVIYACQQCVESLPWKDGKIVIKEQNHL